MSYSHFAIKYILETVSIAEFVQHDPFSANAGNHQIKSNLGRTLTMSRASVASEPMNFTLAYLLFRLPGAQFNWGKNPGENPGENPDENPGENPVKKLQ